MKWQLDLPEIEFDSWDPGILSGVVEFTNKFEISSRLAANIQTHNNNNNNKIRGELTKFWFWLDLKKKLLPIPNLSMELKFGQNVIIIFFLCSFSCGHIRGSFSMANSYRWNGKNMFSITVQASI